MHGESKMHGELYAPGQVFEWPEDIEAIKQ
jgi:hypothetical protein